MNCALCTLTLSDEGHKIELPCCNGTCHTYCYMEKVRIHASYDHIIAHCPLCDFGTMSAITYTAEHQPAPILITPELRAEVKIIKQSIAERNKRITAAKKAINTVFKTFKDHAYPLLASIRALKRDALRTVRNTADFRAGARAQRRTETLVENMQQKFDIYLQDLPGLGITNYWTRNMNRVLMRKFWMYA